ncbi:oligopeptide/dipeptide ABC transporter ATP-binding protein [Labrys wisconsinensis]|uniref:Oligopeptide/dipeptide ABC transporter ATP-binding protein n=1 Tax=Labrys wisconsinensis TaxID=425677 RepID=A0ABU0JI18_9HYPH|nr:ABC transporter ATP-binding protein [Labrys wisconsinensis]MDQ0473931.1 oligopeptide/dipeptide ABC transporter ATP-binding protein [Labrys wisconsinensis]
MTLLEVRGLHKYFPVGAGRRGLLSLRVRRSRLHAVEDVSFSLGAGEALGLVGESGSGKSTLASLVARLADPSSGTILLEGEDIGAVPAARAARAAWRSHIQMVFQDPYDSLDPRRSVREAIAAPLARLEGLGGARLEERVRWALDRVHLPAELAGRLPHRLSGGQLARAGIARAIALRPRLLILDEPTSALDVSIQAVILKLVDELRRDLGIALLFVSHDLNVVRLLCQRVMVMYLGQVVERGSVDAVLGRPSHPYTAGLVAAIPALGRPPRTGRARLTGEPGSPIDPKPDICRFETRCASAGALCRTRQPPFLGLDADHGVACHHPLRGADAR